MRVQAMTILSAHRLDPATADAGRSFAPAVYGSLLVTTLVAVQWRHAADPELIALTVVSSVVVFWLAHAWAEIVDRRVRGPIGLRGAAEVAAEEASMLSAAVVPSVLLALPLVIGLDVDTAIGLALLASLAELFLWGLAAGRAAHATWPLAVGVALVDFALGLLVVALKVVFIH